MDRQTEAGIGTAGAVLARVRHAFDAGVAALARQCADGGRLVNARVDAQQVAAFEMAWAGAELLAAENAVAAVAASGPGVDELDARLALVFTVDAVVAVL